MLKLIRRKGKKTNEPKEEKGDAWLTQLEEQAA